MKFCGYSLAANPLVAATEARRAERAGLDGWFSGETNFNVVVAATAACTATSNISVGTAIAVAFARSPMTLAYAANDLQTVSSGRFVLGLGTQVSAHIRRRFSMPWSDPVERMREYVAALHAIWRAWQTGDALDFQGQWYTHTLMTPFFAGHMEHPPPPVAIAALGPDMTEVAGETADVLLTAPLTSKRYLEEVTLPALSRGASRTGRQIRDIEVAANVMVVTGADNQERKELADATRRQIGFYASTPAYRRVLDLHGWGELGDELTELSRQRRFDEMGSVVDDEVLNTFAVVIDDPDKVGAAVRARLGGTVDRAMLYPLWKPSEEALSALTT